MKITAFRASDFRNIESCSLSFESGVNLLIGNNAEGKTNALEGIYIFARGKSFRHAEEKDLIRFSADGFKIEIEYIDKSGKNTLEYRVYKNLRKRRKNGYEIKSASEMVGSFKAVLFYPDDLNLVKGGPEERREFLNVCIGQCYPEYISHYKRFKNALENRNKILKNISKGLYYDIGEFNAWSESLAEYSSYIYEYRKEYIKKLEVYAKRVISEISLGSEYIDFIYKSNIEKEGLTREEIRDEYIKKYTENIEKEGYAGVSLYGPQRDDLIINICGSYSRSFASQGQQRSIVLALKLAEGEVIYEIYGEYPVYLFDDVLSELDIERQKYVLSKKGEKQIIISSCEENEAILNPDKIIRVRAGVYE